MIAANRAALERRFPAILAWIADAAPPGPVEEPRTPARALSVAGLQLASGYDPDGEARLQARLVPERAPRATCYGIGGGALARALLARPALFERLVVALFHPGVARAALARFDAADWLSDPRVELARARDLAEVEAPFAAAPACLRLAEDAAASLADRVFLELATPRIAREAALRRGDAGERLRANRALLERGGDLARLFGSRPGARAFVAGAGPSLARALGALAARAHDEPLIAVDAALAPLVAAGAVPDAVVVLDPHPRHQLAFFAGDLTALRAVPLVCSALVHPDVLARWPGPRLPFAPAPRARLAAGLDPALARALERCPELWSAGSVAHPAVDLAVRLGAREVVLAGLDFAHVGGRTHVEGSFYARDDAAAPARAGGFVLDARGRRVPSTPSLVGYLRDLERYVRRHPEVRFVNLSSEGARIQGAEHPEVAR